MGRMNKKIRTLLLIVFAQTEVKLTEFTILLVCMNKKVYFFLKCIAELSKQIFAV